MKTSISDCTSVQTSALKLARLSGSHGYRIDGDNVHLNAMFALLHPEAHQRSWALQLWACPSAPVSAQDLAGHMIASVSLPPMGEIADEVEHFEVNSPAWLPAGNAEHVMVLVLASGHPEHGIQVQDFAVFSSNQQFAQPQLSGSVGYRVDGNRVQISVERIENPRPTTNRSGTLALELWALRTEFTGGKFQGHQLAGVEIGALDGQYELALQPIDLAFNAPPVGNWNVVLMLREWTANGFVTRDFTNFAVPFVTAPVVVETASVAAKPAAVTSATPATQAAKPVVAVMPAPQAVKPVVAATPAAQAAKPVVAAAPAKAAAPAAPKGISVNSARVEELATIDGITKKIAEGIVKKRPYASLDDLERVKGLGAKTLSKIRSKLRL